MSQAIHWVPCEIAYNGPYQDLVASSKSKASFSDYFKIEASKATYSGNVCKSYGKLYAISHFISTQNSEQL